MSSYNHLTLKDRECILLGVTLKDTYQVIAQRIGCSKATVSREIKRNGGRKAYSAVKAQENYQGRPVSCENRSRFGHWEGDTIRGKTGRSALVTLVDRKSRYLLSQRVLKVNAKHVTQAMIDLLHTVTPKRVRTLTPDRGTEFAGYREVSQELSIPVYFPDPHAPQQRGTNENTNGLIREYFPKGTDLDQLTDQDIDKFVRDLNHRPRKILGWKSPFEVFFGTKLRLI